jgi:precorrin-6Y C5,15-methyltransferase (decarboxylating)
VIVDVVGVVGGEVFGPESREALRCATTVVGARRHLDQVEHEAVKTIELAGPLDDVLDEIDACRSAGECVCVLASGDPGLFGIVRLLGERFGPGALLVHPAPSSVALAFAAVGRSWDDAVVVSAHGRPLDDAVIALRGASTAAVLTSPDNPPEAVGKALLAAGIEADEVVVASRLGEPGAAVVRTDLAGLADGMFDPLAVVLILGAAAVGPGLRWGLPEAEFEHRDGMITKAEVRAVALGKLGLPANGVLWDLGTGSGSVAVECARLAPGLRVVAVDRDPDQVERARRNAAAHGVEVEVVHGSLPEVLDDLPAPDRVFLGGGGLEALDAALDRLRPGGVVVATYALVARAAEAHRRLGAMTQVAVSRAVPVADLGVRLEAENPVFVCWGPDHG